MGRGVERGMSGSVQLAVLLPLAVGIFLLLLQWSLVSWAEATALAAAQESAAQAAALDGTVADGQAAGRDVAANGSLSEVAVAVDRGARQTTATVSGRAVAVLWPQRVTRTVVATTERVT